MTERNMYATSSPLNFLVIEDREIIRKVLIKMLRVGRHGVSEASDGEEGLRQMRSSAFDAVFTDLNMPGLTGWEVAREVKKVNPSCVVVLITGFAQQVDRTMMKGSGVDFILTKPFRLEKLLEVVGEIASLREREVAAGDETQTSV